MRKLCIMQRICYYINYIALITFPDCNSNSTNSLMNTLHALGETIDRNYDWSKFTKLSLYGAPTPNDPTGKQVRNSLYWVTQAQR